MHDILPYDVVQRLRDRYLTGVADAVSNFDQGEGDEDALTGALGQALATRLPLVVPSSAGVFEVKVSYQKLRGRGFGAPEKRYGSDGLFQLEVFDSEGRVIRRKGLPFQAKKDWHGTNRGLANQAARMVMLTGNSIVVDFKNTGYFACNAKTVAECQGRRGEAFARGEVKGLGQVLGDDFLACRIGTVGLGYDKGLEEYWHDSRTHHVITTSVQGHEWMSSSSGR